MTYLSNKQALVLDLNGHTLNMSYSIAPGDLTITGNGTILFSQDAQNTYLFSIGDNAKLTIENGTFICEKSYLFFTSNDINTPASITINGGYFEVKYRFAHLQAESGIEMTINDGIFVSTNGNIFSGSGLDKSTVTLNKCVFAAINENLYNCYSSDTHITIPAGKTYVIDGTFRSNITEDKNARELDGKVLYVGKYSDFAIFGLMGNSNASTHVHNQPYGDGIHTGASGHNAHSAVFIHATPNSSFAKVALSSNKGEISVRPLGNDVYCIRPFVSGMQISATGQRVELSELAITTLDGTIPAVGENFWDRATYGDATKKLEYPEGVYIGNTVWYNEGKYQMLESSATCEAGKVYYLYIKIYFVDGYELAPLAPVTIDGKEAPLNGHNEIWYRYDTSAPTALPESTIKNDDAKQLINGQLIIRRNGTLYNAQGANL